MVAERKTNVEIEVAYWYRSTEESKVRGERKIKDLGKMENQL